MKTMDNQATAVFISYSHADLALLAPVVKLLRVNQSLVFQDVDRIRPGKKWRDEITRAIANAHLVVVFWCRHASRSEEVSREWRTAIDQRKDLLPLLLDETPLPRELIEYQWIDFRGTVGASHASTDAPASHQASGKSGRRWSLVGFGAALATLAGVGLATTFLMGRKDHGIPLPTSSPGGSTPVTATGILLLAGVVLSLIIVLLGWRRRRRSTQTVSHGAGSAATPMERQIAAELEKEIIRRAGPLQEGRPQ